MNSLTLREYLLWPQEERIRLVSNYARLFSAVRAQIEDDMRMGAVPHEFGTLPPPWRREV